MNVGQQYLAISLTTNKQVRGTLLNRTLGGSPVLQSEDKKLHCVEKDTMEVIKLSDTFISTTNKLSIMFGGKEREILGAMSTPFGEGYTISRN